jgi:hypothetical protein
MGGLKKHLFFCALVGGALCCSSPYAPERLPTRYVRFGHGGGITGEVKTWMLLSNGQMFKATSRQSEPVGCCAGARRQGRRLFREVEAMKLCEKPLFEHPGNVYRFVEWIEEGRSCRTTWGSPSHPIDSALEGLHRRLMDLVRE